MSVEANKKLVESFINTIINTGDVDEIEKFISYDYVEVHDGVRHPVGIEGAKQHVLGVRKTYPDLHLTIDQQIGEGPWVATCITARGTHLGIWLDIKPTGKPVVFTGVNINKIVDGRIVEHGGAANMLFPLLEIGAIKLINSGDR
jgi:predicted ester cyclase